MCQHVKKRVGNKSDSKAHKNEIEQLPKRSQSVSLIDDEVFSREDKIINDHSKNGENNQNKFSRDIHELDRKINELECNMRAISNTLQSEIDQCRKDVKILKKK